MVTRRHLLASASVLLMPRILHAAGNGRIVVAGGALTEIVVALGEARRLAGVDATSLYPPQIVAPLPKIGYLRTLSAEGILSLDPGLLIASDQAGPPAIIAQLRQAGLPVTLVPEAHTVDAVPGKVHVVARALGHEAEGMAMAAAIQADLAAIQDTVTSLQKRPRVLFVMSTSAGRIMAAGQDTAADLMVGLAGGHNIVQGYAGYKPLTAEAALAGDPDVILLPQHSLEALGGQAGVAALPALKDTPAARTGRIHAMDTLYLLGLGPRIASAARELAMLFHPGLALPALPQRPWS
jgi:iron complex transport system substrate-binding protein